MITTRRRILFNPLDLSGKKILITGASSGIGRATSVYLSKLGATLILVARNEERLSETLSLLEGNNHKCLTVDFSEVDDLDGLFNKAIEDGIKLEGLVHCAGIAQVLPVKMLTRERMLKEMNVNYFTFIELVRQFSKIKYSHGGSIVGISSIAGHKAEKCQTNYSASKAAMDIATQALSLELAEKKIRINTILPGVIQTEMVERSKNFGFDMNDIKSKQVLGVGQPEDVAAMVAFLVSDMSRLITGRKFFVDGGRF